MDYIRIKEMEHIEICNKFYQSFQEKNIKIIRDMVHESVELRDWETIAIGKDQFVRATQKIFDSVKNISILIKNQGIQSNKISNSINIFNEIEINLNDSSEKLDVVDIFEIELKSKLIKSIRAYKK